ncbi:MAG: hypothetical protein KAS32_03940 [Candidatus Peribacteraceae bacterium]|nr:hypothetical protein [Candidatus Peribacteraceae bacterium]
MSLIRSKKRASTKGVTKKEPALEMEKQAFKDAYLLSAETGDNIRELLSELPHKYTFVGPILRVFEKSVRGNIVIDLPKGTEIPVLSKQLPGDGQRPQGTALGEIPSVSKDASKPKQSTKNEE